MTWNTRLFRLLLVGGSLWVAACGENITFPSPKISSLSPSSIAAGHPAFTLTVTGSNFVPQTAVLVNGAARVTIFASGTQLTTMINASDVTNPGTFLVSATTPSPGGGTTTTLTFTISPVASPIPRITSISPSAALAGSSGFTLSIIGSNFVPQSQVTVNGANRSAAFMDSEHLQGSINSTDLLTAGTLQIGVLNPEPGGGESNLMFLGITNPIPRLTSISPTSSAAGGASAVITLTGTGLDAASVVEFNGSPRPTNFGNNTQISVTLTAADLLAAGVNQIEVVNPGPGGGTSNSLTFDVNPTSTGAGLPELVDLAPDGSQANNGIGANILDSAGPAISSNGQLVTFASISNNLVANDFNAHANIFERSTCFGAAAGCTQTTALVNISSSGAQADADSDEPSMDSAGRFIAFRSKATNLDPSFPIDGAFQQIFLRDTGGTTQATTPGTTHLVSVASDGIQPANADCFSPAASPDGRFVAFVSAATNLVKGFVSNGFAQVYLRDTCAGQVSTCDPSTLLVSSPSLTTGATAPANQDSSQPAVSNDGQFVSFTSAASDLIAGVAPSATQIFARQTCVNTTSGCTVRNFLISTPQASTSPTAPADAASSESTLTPDGRFFAFASLATNLGVASGGVQQIYLRDTCTGATKCSPSTTLVSTAQHVPPFLPADGTSESPSISSKGQFVAFDSLATNLGTDNGFKNVYIRNTCAGVASGTACTKRVINRSVSASFGVGNGDSFFPALSGDGHTVSFISRASNLVAHDNNNLEDVFLSFTTF